MGTAAVAGQAFHIPEDSLNEFSPAWYSYESRGGRSRGACERTIDPRTIKAESLPGQVERDYRPVVGRRRGSTTRDPRKRRTQYRMNEDGQGDWRSAMSSNNQPDGGKKINSSKLKPVLSETQQQRPTAQGFSRSNSREMIWESSLKQSFYQPMFPQPVRSSNGPTSDAPDPTVTIDSADQPSLPYGANTLTGSFHSSHAPANNEGRTHESGNTLSGSEEKPDRLTKPGKFTQVSLDKDSVEVKGHPSDIDVHEISGSPLDRVNNVITHEGLLKTDGPENEARTLRSPLSQDADHDRQVNWRPFYPIDVSDGSSVSPDSALIPTPATNMERESQDVERKSKVDWRPSYPIDASAKSSVSLSSSFIPTSATNMDLESQDAEHKHVDWRPFYPRAASGESSLSPNSLFIRKPAMNMDQESSSSHCDSAGLDIPSPIDKDVSASDNDIALAKDTENNHQVDWRPFHPIDASESLVSPDSSFISTPALSTDFESLSDHRDNVIPQASHSMDREISATNDDSAISEIPDQGSIRMVLESEDDRMPSREDKMDQLLRETVNRSFGVAHCLQLLNDKEFYQKTHLSLISIPGRQTELLSNAKFPFGSKQIPVWQREDLNMTKQIAYRLVYQACSRLLRLHREHEAVDLFVQTLGRHRIRVRWAIGKVELPMRLPTRWSDRGTLLRLLGASLHVRKWSSVQILFELAVSYHGQDAALTTVRNIIGDMLVGNHLDEAAEALTSVPRLKYRNAMALELCIEISSKTMRAALAQDNLQVAMRTFEWTEKQGLPNKGTRLGDIVRICLEHHSRSNAASEDASLDTKAEDTSLDTNEDISLDTKAKDLQGTHPILWVMSASRGLPYTAIALVQHLMQAESGWSTKEDLVTVCNAVLSRVWRETSNFRLLQGLYEDLRRSAKAHSGLPVSTYNCWLAICYKSGHRDEAQKCLECMQSADGPGADISSFGHIMRAQAFDGEWLAVEAMLVRLHKSGQMPVFSRDCCFSMSIVFREFMRKFGLERGWNFITKAIKEYGLEPSVRLSDEFLVRCVLERQWSMLSTWFRWLKEHGIDLRVNALSVLRMMGCYFTKFRPERRLFIRICFSLRSSRKGLISNQLWRKALQAMAFDARRNIWKLDSPVAPVSSIWESHVLAPVAKLEQDLQTLPSVWHVAPKKSNLLGSDMAEQSDLQDAPSIWSGPRFSSSVLDHNMIMAISLHRPAEAVQLFLESLSSAGSQHSESSLSIAVDASLRANNGYPGQAQQLLHEAEAIGMDVTGGSQHFLLQRLRMHRGEYSQHRLTDVVLKFYKSLLAIGKNPRHHICIAAAEHLIYSGRAEGGIQLLSLILKSDYAERLPMDIVAMTTFMKGYAQIGHLQGIRWVVDKVLGEDMRIDAVFCHEMGEARKPLTELFERPGLSEESKQQVQDAITQLNDWRAECLERRYQQQMRTESDGWELVKAIQELSPESASNDEEAEEAEEDLEILENGELMKRYAGIEGPFSENAARLAYGPVRPAKARSMLKEPSIECT